jgi:hypothetical protein
MKFDFLQIMPPVVRRMMTFIPSYCHRSMRDNYGPIVIPKKGMAITVTPENYRRWEIFIQRDGHLPELRNDGTITIDGKPTNTYVVEKDYVFGVGDHRDNSLDSRYWGFIPRENVVGTPMIVYFSVMLTDEYRGRTRHERARRCGWSGSIPPSPGTEHPAGYPDQELLITVFNPETIRFGRIGTVIG